MPGAGGGEKSGEQSEAAPSRLGSSLYFASPRGGATSERPLPPKDRDEETERKRDRERERGERRGLFLWSKGEVEVEVEVERDDVGLLFLILRQKPPPLSPPALPGVAHKAPPPGRVFVEPRHGLDDQEIETEENGATDRPMPLDRRSRRCAVARRSVVRSLQNSLSSIPSLLLQRLTPPRREALCPSTHPLSL